MLNQSEELKVKSLISKHGSLSRIYEGSGSPNGVIVERPGALYLDSSGLFWVKQTGIDTNTGWVSK